ncbi:MAG: hypothetical protein P9M15_01045 [Candidatus Electryoneaceae bacterium]|nr:hypothetical protein [Candidatus Electryoneaceae bacterium]
MQKPLLFLLTICLFAGTLQAEPIELVYDSGNRSGVFGQTGQGDIEGVRFTPEHPCSLLSFQFRVSGTGMMEWHVWADNGGNMPDIRSGFD